jgi:hypothetical protein
MNQAFSDWSASYRRFLEAQSGCGACLGAAGPRSESCCRALQRAKSEHEHLLDKALRLLSRAPALASRAAAD